jgi:hypothetical protein
MTRKRGVAFAVFVACLLSGLQAMAQATLTVSKSYPNVVLTWTGGAGPFTVIKSTEGSFAGCLTVVATNATSPVTDAGACTNGRSREFYAVIEAADVLAVTTPQAGFVTNAPCVSASGTAAVGVVSVWVNGVKATLSNGQWSAPIVPVSATGSAGTKPITLVVTAFNGSYYCLGYATVTGYIRNPTAALRQPCKPRTAGK